MGIWVSLGQIQTVIKIGTIPACAYGVAKTFDWFEKKINESARRVIRKWLQDPNVSMYVGSWTAAMSDVIDRVFGKSPFSWRFILRSCAASLIAVGVMTVLFWRFDPGSLSVPQDVYARKLMIVFAVVTNLIPDYLSLLMSRWIVRHMVLTQNVRRIMGFLLLDVGLTSVIAAVGVAATWAFTNMLWLLYSVRTEIYAGRMTIQGIPPSLRHLPIDIHFDLNFCLGTFVYAFQRCFTLDAWRGAPIIPLMFFAAFFTSLWVFLYVISAIVLRLAMPVEWLLRFTRKYFDMKKPLSSLGRVAAALSFCVLVLFDVVAALISR